MFFYDYKSMKFDSRIDRPLTKRECVLLGIYLFLIFIFGGLKFGWGKAFVDVIGLVLSAIFVSLLLYVPLKRGWAWVKKPTPPFLP